MFVTCYDILSAAVAGWEKCGRQHREDIFRIAQVSADLSRSVSETFMKGFCPRLSGHGRPRLPRPSVQKEASKESLPRLVQQSLMQGPRLGVSHRAGYISLTV